MSEKPSSIRNLGPASDTFYARAGITTAQELEKAVLKSRFEAIKARVGAQPKSASAIERELDALGVIKT